MTIFGFNTDVPQSDVVYHVQSEARQTDLLLQTLVFVKGQCVGKHAVSYAHKVAEPAFSNEAMHELLKEQHKGVVQAIQDARMESALSNGIDIQDVGGNGLSLRWGAVPSIGDATRVAITCHVADGGGPASSAVVTVRTCTPAEVPELARAIADSTGSAEVAVPLTENVRRDSAVMVQAVYGGKSATRKLRLKK